jgi:hypothetical protein
MATVSERCTTNFVITPNSKPNTLLNGRDSEEQSERVAPYGAVFLSTTGFKFEDLLAVATVGKALRICGKCAYVLSTAEAKIKTLRESLIIPFRLADRLPLTMSPPPKTRQSRVYPSPAGGRVSAWIITAMNLFSVCYFLRL